MPSACLACARIPTSPYPRSSGAMLPSTCFSPCCRIPSSPALERLPFRHSSSTLFGEIIPQAYFSRNALQMAARLTPLLKAYRVLLFPVAKPTAIILTWWLGPEGITFLRERDFRAFITRHVGVAGRGRRRIGGHRRAELSRPRRYRGAG